ncbi:hypothetical protein HOLleu_32436 [Holothuria leucospilota]|uniref:Uncharacterized protein n=1 Tax=Holothuria leucospilota TaxID=206669 RepID=A0A9Q1BIP4_HOLLE|nr:hypothetical protein HOLleu_32436 [Holothuria leucospilota]
MRNTAFNGLYLENLFNFGNFGANFLAVYMNGEQFLCKPLKPSFTEDDGANYIRAYHTLFSGTDKTNQDEGNAISRKDYLGGYTLYAFDLTPIYLLGGTTTSKSKETFAWKYNLNSLWLPPDISS